MNYNTRPYYPTVLQLLGLFLIYIAFAIPIIIAILGTFTLLDYENQSLSNMIAYTATGAFTLWYAWKKKVRLENDRKVFLFGKVNWPVYVILIPAILSAGMFTDPVSVLIPIPDFIRNLFDTLSQNDICTFLTVCIFGPVFEELFFRGIVLNGFLKLFNPWKAIILSALFFGLFHLNPWQFFAAFIVGIVIGYVYWKTRSLLPCLYSHWLNNTLYWLLSVLVLPDKDNFSDLFPSQGWYYGIVFLSLFVLLLSFYLLRSFLERISPGTEQETLEVSNE